MGDQFVEDMQDQRGTLDPVTVRILYTVMHEFLQRITDGQIDPYAVLCQFCPVADDLKIALIFHE
jgi:hypothetical protein